MAAPFSASAPYPLRLGVEPIREGVYTLTLDDDAGHSGAGVFTLSVERPLGFGFPTWFEFLRAFADRDPGKDALVLFGRDLFKAAIEDLPRVHDAWQGIAGAAGARPPALTLELGSHTEAFAGLPFELLHDPAGFVFARPGAALRRAYAELTEKRFALPSEPRVLFAWANPPGAGDAFEPEPHAAALARVFGPRLERFDHATREGLRKTVRQAWVDGDPFHYVHLLAHGFRDIAVAGVVLCGEDGDAELVDAQRLGQVLNNAGVRLAFLCSCQTAVDGGVAFSGVGQQLLSPRGGDLPTVVATQANLPVRRSAELGESFYRHLARSGDPGEALVAARREAYDVGGFGWSVPILLSRPAPTERAAIVTVAGLPARRATYLERPELEEAILSAVDRRRLVSVVGLPGIGKTEAGAEAARRAVTRGLFGRAIHREARAGMNTGDLRRTLGAALGMTELPADDEGLAYAFAAQPGRLLLVIDNAEDLMLAEESQLAFRDQLDVLLSIAPRLHVLLTTRWPVGATQESEFEVDVPPLPRQQMASLLEKELRAQGGYREDWPSSPAWQELLDLFDGHPRTLWLAARQLAGQAASLERVVARLRELKEDAILDADLVGRPDVYQALAKDKKARLRSLVAGMDLSFEVLVNRHPAAIGVFLALSLFPAGLPEVVARTIAGEEGREALDQLLRYHLAQWRASRVYYPVPLQWYAERRRRERKLDETRFRRRALDGFVPFVEACDRVMMQGSVLSGAESLLQELPTLEALVEAAIAESWPAPPLAAIAAAARNPLDYSDQHGFARRLYLGGIAAAEAAGDRLGEAGCLKNLADLAVREGDLAAARPCYEAALAIVRDIRAPRAEASCLNRLGDLAQRESDLEASRRCYSAALAKFRELDDRLGEANCRQSLGNLALRESRLEEARQSYAAALPIFRQIPAPLGEANCLKSLGDVAMREDDAGAALESYAAALALFQAIGDRLGEANCLQSLGDLAMREPDFAKARLQLATALPLFREARDRLGEANCLHTLGELAVQENDFESARRDLAAALPIFREIGSRLGEANCLLGLGDLAMREAEPAAARQSYAAALPIFRAIHARLGEANCLQRLASAALSEGRAAAAFAALREVLALFEGLGDQLGKAVSLGCLARAARQSGRLDQALLLAEASLELDRRIGDRFGQTVNLALQAEIWIEIQDFGPALGAMLAHRALAIAMRDSGSAGRFQRVLESVLPQLPEKVRAALHADPEAFRRTGIEAARERFAATGLDLFAPPDPEPDQAGSSSS